MSETQEKLLANLNEMTRKQARSKANVVMSIKSAGPGDFEENFIRREKRRKLETQREISKMRAELPVYDINDIRLHRLPLYEALVLHLEETGYVNTKAYLEQLFELNEQIRKSTGPQDIIWGRPYLKHNDNVLKKLSDALMKAEDAHNEDNFRGETEILLTLAIDFGFSSIDWFWLAEELALQAISNAQAHISTGKHEAIARYVYAKLLMERVRDFEKAEQELIIVRERTTGKSWDAKAFLPAQRGSSTLFMDANYLLHICYLKQAKYWFKTDYKTALEFATLARKRALEACYHDGETEALFIKGECELNMGTTKNAVNTFYKAYYIQAKLKSEKGMCEARVQLSKAYLMHGCTRLALKTLIALKSMAEEHGFQYYLAQAYRYLGEYFLNYGEPEKATPLFSDALNLFYDTGNLAEADQVRNLGALSYGLELMPHYIALLQRTDRRFPGWFDNLIKLVKWKDSRQPFWPERIIRKSIVEECLSHTTDSIERQPGTSSSVENARTTNEEFEELSMIFDPQIESKTSINVEVLPEQKSEISIPISQEEDETETHNIVYSV